MGPDKQSPESIFLVESEAWKEPKFFGIDGTGKAFNWKTGVSLDVNIKDEIGPEDYDAWDDMDMSFQIVISPPKTMRCTSRKRFIKLLMAAGWSRNEAAIIARIQIRPKDSYQDRFLGMWLLGGLKREAWTK